ncbi:MAG: hypothetical protein GX589_00680 [Deltaproteobacteria bacterium]|nr:hypothetical protein [Deltaproteobacteria bacterium]
MNTPREVNANHLWSDFVCLMGHVGRISIWEPKSLPVAKRVARKRANERRLKLIKELSNNLSKSIQEQLRGSQALCL